MKERGREKGREREEERERERKGEGREEEREGPGREKGREGGEGREGKGERKRERERGRETGEGREEERQGKGETFRIESVRMCVSGLTRNRKSNRMKLKTIMASISVPGVYSIRKMTSCYDLKLTFLLVKCELHKCKLIV